MELAPVRLVLQNVSIAKRRLEITVQTLDLELSLFRLLKRESLFSIFLQMKLLGKDNSPPSKSPPSPFMWNISASQMSLFPIISQRISKIIKLGKRTRFLDVRASRPDFPNDTSHLVFLIQKDGTLQWRGDLNLTTLKSLDIPVSSTLRLKPTLPAQAKEKSCKEKSRERFRFCSFPAGKGVDFRGALPKKQSRTISDFQPLGAKRSPQCKSQSDFRSHFPFARSDRAN